MNRKYWIIGLILIVVLVGGWLGWRAYQNARAAQNEWETEPAVRAELRVTVRADGMVRANQSAVLDWRTSGVVAERAVPVGRQVEAGEVLQELETTSLSQGVILAQANLVQAERELEDLRLSQRRQAEARVALQEAEQALEDGRNPALLQAQARAAAAQARQALEEAEDYYAIVTKTTPAEAVEQARANLLLAENALRQTEADIERLEQRLKNPERYPFQRIVDFMQDALEGLELLRIQQQLSYERAQEKYTALLEPPDPIDVLVAQGNVFKAQAALAQAQRELERVADGLSPGDLARLEAAVGDARREWERWQDGPDAAEIQAAEARLAAARAALSQVHIEAPFAGSVTAVYTRPGDQVSTGTEALRLDDLSHMLVDLQLSEIDINRVEAGQEVTLSLEAAPGIDYQGHVLETAVIGEEVGGVVRYTVVVEVDRPDERIRPGMTAAATIVTTRLEDVLQVPSRALRLDQGERVVYVLRGDTVLPVAVTPGVASETRTQILSGDLQAGDLIVLDPDPDLLP